MALKDIVDIMMKINAGAYSFEAANPRHEHEYHVFERVKLPAGKILIPGAISHTTNLVEHPELVGRTDRAVRQDRRARERYRRRRLRVCRVRPEIRRYPSQRRLAQVRRVGRGRPIGDRRPVALSCRRAAYRDRVRET